MTAQDFSVSGQTVLVVGAARSGVAAAHLLVRRGAKVTLTDRQPQIPQEAELRAAGVVLELGGHVPATFESSQLICRRSLAPGPRACL
jgi:UDP-N-acetylmuramoylalanine--D-glutamate ligase